MTVHLSELTTLRLGGAVEEYVPVTSTDALIEAVSAADAAGRELLVLGGGSNLVVGDEPFAGTVVHVRSQGMDVVDSAACAGVTVRVAAGQVWDEFVAHAVAEGWSGVEALSGIPGSSGATPVQNVGAYGQEVAQTIATVRTWDRSARRVVTFANADCEFAYRHSLFKAERFRGGPRYIVLEVTFQLALADVSAPIRYAELARSLGVEVGQRAPSSLVRSTVLGLRAGKGMVLDDADHDTWSAGSFFTNPIVSPTVAAALPDDAPRWPMSGEPGAEVKLSAAWLIEHAGFGKGFGLPGPASLSTKHTLALTNRGSATSADLLALAAQVRDGVRSAYGVTLVPEPVMLNCSL